MTEGVRRATIAHADVEQLGTILGVWAHPDDEAYLSAGIMASARVAGVRVVCVTATRGEAGTQDPQRWPLSQLAEIREAEMAVALQVLGVEEHHWLDYVDGTCASVVHDEGIGRVLAILEDVDPATVLTFGPDGMTDHPDHKAVSDWVTGAFRRWDKPSARLHYATLSDEWARVYAPTLSALDVYGHGTPPHTPRAELSIEFRLPHHVHEQKLSALRAQASQVEGLLTIVGEEFYRAFTAAEFFRPADLDGRGDTLPSS